MSNESEVAVLFADVVGSTRLYELLGDHQARDMIVACIDIMREATDRNRGQVIKTIGDEILAIFPTASKRNSSSKWMGVSIWISRSMMRKEQNIWNCMVTE